MRGLTVSDKDARNVLTFDLKDILPLLGEKGLKSAWSIKGLEAVDGEAAQELHALSDTEQVVSGERLQELAAAISQTIDGEFAGSLNESTKPWIRIRAVDSSAFDIITADPDVYTRIKDRFADVVELFNVDA